jgi:hypothetical protein
MFWLRIRDGMFANDRIVRFEIGRGRVQRERERTEIPPNEEIGGRGCHADGDVRFPPAEVQRLVRGEQLEVDPRIHRREPRKLVHQEADRYRVHQRDSDQAFEPLVLAMQSSLERVDLGLDAFSATQHRVAFFGQPQPERRACEEVHAQALFEILEPPCDSRVMNTEVFGGSAHRPSPYDRTEYPEIVPIDASQGVTPRSCSRRCHATAWCGKAGCRRCYQK